MVEPDGYSSIQEARRSFNAELHTARFERVHADTEHLRQLITYLDVEPNGVYLDLATGNGYVGFEIARQRGDCRVIGVDIADEAIGQNIEKARKLGLSNIEFRVIDGITLPFPNETFDGVICRYALHHFPKLSITLKDIGKILKNTGRLIIADPVRNDLDDEDLINRFQALQPDGHVRIYRQGELLDLFHDCGFKKLRSNMTTISFSRESNSEYEALLKDTSPDIREKYGIDLRGTEIFLCFDILNIVFSKIAERT